LWRGNAETVADGACGFSVNSTEGYESPIIGFSLVACMGQAAEAGGRVLTEEEEGESLEALYWPTVYLVAETL